MGATWIANGGIIIIGRKFVPHRNWGGKAVDETNI